MKKNNKYNLKDEQCDSLLQYRICKFGGIGICLILAVIAIVAYFPVFSAGFVWDDFPAIHENLFLKQPGGFLKIWTTHGKIPNESHYWPLVYTTYYLEYKIAGETPFIYHFTNLLLHIANSILLFLIMRKMYPSRRLLIPGCAAFLFALHPVHVESVAWIIERKDVLSGFFYLLSFLFFLNYESEKKKSFYLLSLFFFLCALLSKTVAVTLPAAILLWQYYNEKKFCLKKHLQTIPYFVTGLIYGLIDTMLNKRMESADFGNTILQKILIASKALCFYFQKFFFPQNLMTIYPRWEISAGDFSLYLYPVCLAILIGGLFIFRKKITIIPLLYVLYFILTLAPMLGIIDFTFMEHSFVADRFQYLASIGLCILSALIIQGILKRGRPQMKNAAIFLFITVLFVLAVITYKQAATYKNIKTLFTHNVRLNPDSFLAHNNLASVYMKEEDYENAKRHLNEALRIKPDYAEAHNNLGMILSHEGKTKEAFRHYKIAYEKGAPWSAMINDLAWYMATSSDPEIRDTKKALHIAKKINADTGGLNPGILDTLAAAYAAEGDFGNAVKIAEKALALCVKDENTNLKLDIEKRLELYKNRKAYSE